MISRPTCRPERSLSLLEERQRSSTAPLPRAPAGSQVLRQFGDVAPVPAGTHSTPRSAAQAAGQVMHRRCVDRFVGNAAHRAPERHPPCRDQRRTPMRHRDSTADAGSSLSSRRRMARSVAASLSGGGPKLASSSRWPRAPWSRPDQSARSPDRSDPPVVSPACSFRRILSVAGHDRHCKAEDRYPGPAESTQSAAVCPDDVICDGQAKTTAVGPACPSRTKR